MQKKIWVVKDYGVDDEQWFFTDENLAIEFRNKYIDRWMDLAQYNVLFVPSRREMEEDVVIYSMEANTSLEDYWKQEMEEFEKSIKKETKEDILEEGVLKCTVQ